MGRKKGRKKKKHIFLYDPENQKKIDDLRDMYPDKTYDEIFKAHLNVPPTDKILKTRFYEIAELLEGKYKDPKTQLLAADLWTLLLNSADGEFDIDRVMYDIRTSLVHKIYLKKKGRDDFP